MMHAEQGFKVAVKPARVAQSRRYKGSARVVLDLEVQTKLGKITVTVDRENFLNEIARSIGQTVSVSKAPAVYDGGNH
jgi:hypothetical protein